MLVSIDSFFSSLSAGSLNFLPLVDIIPPYPICQPENAGEAKNFL
jgi:hypothetical protein